MIILNQETYVAIVLVTLVISALAFALGYFIGKAAK